MSVEIVLFCWPVVRTSVIDRVIHNSFLNIMFAEFNFFSTTASINIYYCAKYIYLKIVWPKKITDIKLLWLISRYDVHACYIRNINKNFTNTFILQI